MRPWIAPGRSAIRSSSKLSPRISCSGPMSGGVITGINSDAELKDSYDKLLARVKQLLPNASMRGVTVQKMIDIIDYELILGAKKDKDFGTVILFGMGGIGVQIFRDFSVGLPPLNQTLARRLMEETEVYKMLQGYRGKAPADLRPARADHCRASQT